MKGQSLPAAHGAPCRLVVAGKDCYFSVKWLERVEVTSGRPADTAREIALRRIGNQSAPSSGMRTYWACTMEPDSTRVGTNHFALQMASFEDLQAIYRQFKEKGLEILRTGSNTYSVGIYFSDSDGNEGYYEDVEAYRRGVWEGDYHRKLEEAAV